MKRSYAVAVLAGWAKPEILVDIYSNNYEEWADHLLHTLEKDLGMSPPSVSEEDFQAIMSVYIGGYSPLRWDEDLSCPKVLDAKKRRAEAKANREARR
jgi:hypothetical protein